MSFKFSVNKVWANEAIGVTHLIGVLEDGKVLSGSRASVPEMPGVDITVKSVVIAPSVSGDKRELTLSVERVSVEPTRLEGCTLISE